FVIREEKRFVVPDRPAQRSSELVPVERLRAALIEEFPRIERVVTEELEDAAMEAIGSRARDRADNTAGGPAILGRVVLRQDAELKDRIDAKIVSCNAARCEAGMIVDIVCRLLL